MRRTILGAVALAAALPPAPALADYVLRDGNGATQTVRAATIGGGIVPWFQPVDGAATSIVYGQASATAGQSGFLVLCASTASQPTAVSLNSYPFNCNLSGALRTDGSGVTQPVSGTVGIQPVTTGGLLISSAVATNTTNSTNVKGTPGQVYKVGYSNNSATVAYLKLYNKATPPTCGTDVPVERIMIPANTTQAPEAVTGAAYSAGIGYCLTGGIADGDVAAVTATTYLVSIYYK